MRQVLRHEPGHLQARGPRRGRRHHRRPVHRRAGHPADHAYLPHRRPGRRGHHPGPSPCRGAFRGPETQADGHPGGNRRHGQVRGGHQGQPLEHHHHRPRRGHPDLRRAPHRPPGEGRGRH